MEQLIPELTTTQQHTSGGASQLADQALSTKDSTRGFYRYNGSLTTPPCAEGVTWLVKRGLLNMAEEDVKWLEQRIGRSDRPVQEMQGRRVSIVV
jgi:carbonic anhydrase